MDFTGEDEILEFAFPYDVAGKTCLSLLDDGARYYILPDIDFCDTKYKRVLQLNEAMLAFYRLPTLISSSSLYLFYNMHRRLSLIPSGLPFAMLLV